MIKLLIIMLGFLFIRGDTKAQFDSTFVRNRIQLCADSLVTGFTTKDWNLYARYSYPPLIASLGGRDTFIKYVSNSFTSVPDSAWKKYETGRILQVIKTPSDLQAIIELFSVIEWQNNRISTTHHLIGESWDGGYFWTFFDSQNDPVSASMIKPNLSDKLIIPTKVEKIEILKNGN